MTINRSNKAGVASSKSNPIYVSLYSGLNSPGQCDGDEWWCVEINGLDLFNSITVLAAASATFHELVALNIFYFN